MIYIQYVSYVYNPIPMTRTYRSRLRSQSAARTRDGIVEAAIRLHAKGVTNLKEVAREADVSLSTVQKHFANREDLFRACTARDMGQGPDPALVLAEIAAIEDPAQRLERTVRTIYGLHEAKLGFTWTSYRLGDQSAVLSSLMRRVGALLDRAVQSLLREWALNASPAEFEAGRGFARGLLSPLTYRALRLEGGLTTDQAIRQTIRALSSLMGLGLP